MTATGDGFEYDVTVRLGKQDYHRFVFAGSIEEARRAVIASFNGKVNMFPVWAQKVEFTGRQRVNGFVRG